MVKLQIECVYHGVKDNFRSIRRIEELLRNASGGERPMQNTDGGSILANQKHYLDFNDRL